MHSTMSEETNKLADIEARIDEAKSRSRRNNLLFYGIPDATAETWAEFEPNIRITVTNIYLFL